MTDRMTPTKGDTVTKPTWRITRQRDWDNWDMDKDAPPWIDADIWGPRGCDDDNRHWDYRFRILDDDGMVYFEGMCNKESIDEFGESDPLHCYGMPDSGATELQIREKGKWVTV